MTTRKVSVNTPLGLLQDLVAGKVKRLEAKKGKHVIEVTMNKGKVQVYDPKYKPKAKKFVVKGTMSPLYDPEDKDHRRILLHRIWRWSLKAKWKKVK